MNNFLNAIVEKVDLDFIKMSRISFPVSIALIIIIIFLFFIKGTNLGVDFTGGMIFEMRSKQSPFDLVNIRKKMAEANIQEATVQYLNNHNEILIRLKAKQGSNQVKKIFSEQDVVYDKIDYVGPQVSSELIYKGILATLTALFGMFFYLLVRFSWPFAAAGVLALIHDVVLSIGFFIITQMEFNVPSIAAILTIIGYSINDSVVIFDRIREYAKNRSVDTINKAIKSTLTRTILTSFTTMLAAVPLIIFGKGTLHDFSWVILFGVFVGTYSSIFIAGPLLKTLRVLTKQ